MPPEISDTTLLLPLLISISFRTSEMLLALQIASLPPYLTYSYVKCQNPQRRSMEKGTLYLYEYVMYKDLQTGPCPSPTCTLPRIHPSIHRLVSHIRINISGLKLLFEHAFGSSFYRGPFRVLHACVKRDPGRRLLRPANFCFEQREMR
jgi:hypothetical protein